MELCELQLPNDLRLAFCKLDEYKTSPMKKIILVLLASFTVSLGLSAQEFEGMIEFKKQEGKRIDNSVWYVKGDLVRVDEFEPGTRILKGCRLINTKDQTAKYLDHKAKTWTEMILTMSDAPQGVTVSESKNTKEILTYKTSEYMMRFPVDTMQLNYWVNFGKFGFFRPALKFMAFDNVFYEYYWQLPAKDNMMPMLVTRTNAKGEETGRLEVTRIDKKVIDAKLFDIPAGYSEKK